MTLPLEKVAKIDAILSAISHADFKKWEINDNYTHIKAIDKDGDIYEITFTPSTNSER